MVEKVEFEVVGKVRYRRKVLENLRNTFVYERIIGVFLDFDEVRYLLHLFDTRKTFSLDLTKHFRR